MMYQVKGIFYGDPVPYVFYRMIAYVYEAQLWRLSDTLKNITDLTIFTDKLMLKKLAS